MIVPHFIKPKTDIITARDRQAISRLNKRRILVLSLSVAFLFVGIGMPALESVRWDRQPAPTGIVQVQGTINASNQTTNGHLYAMLSKVVLNGESVGRNLAVTIWNGAKQDYPVGSRIGFTATVSNILLYEGGILSYAYHHNIRYQATLQSEISLLTTQTRLDEQLRLKVSDLLYKVFDSQTHPIAFAALFGDKSVLDSQTYQMFQATGVAHILSVSGLHVGFLCALLLLLLHFTKLKASKKLVFVALVLLLYSYLCGFSPSVVRASLMCLFGMSAMLLGKQNDVLNAVSVAGIVLLVFKPLAALNVGFMLSFACVFSIILLAKPLASVLSRVIVFSSISKALAVVLAVQVGILPIMANQFRGLPLLSIVANLVVVPLFGAFFSLLVLIVLLALFLPFFAYLFYLPHWILLLILQISALLYAIPSSVLQVLHFDAILIVGLAACLVLCSQYVNFLPKTKAFGVLGLAIVFSLISLLSHIPPARGNGEITFLTMQQSTSVLIESANNQYDLIDVSLYNLKQIDQYLHERKIYQLYTIFMLNNQPSELTEWFCAKYRVGRVVTFASNATSGLLFDNSYCTTRLETLSLTATSFTSYYYISMSDQLKGMYFTMFGTNVFVPSQSFDATNVAELQHFYPQTNMVDLRLHANLASQFLDATLLLPNLPTNSLAGIQNSAAHWTILTKSAIMH